MLRGGKTDRTCSGLGTNSPFAALQRSGSFLGDFCRGGGECNGRVFDPSVSVSICSASLGSVSRVRATYPFRFAEHLALFNEGLRRAGWNGTIRRRPRKVSSEQSWFAVLRESGPGSAPRRRETPVEEDSTRRIVDRSGS